MVGVVDVWRSGVASPGARLVVPDEVYVPGVFAEFE